MKYLKILLSLSILMVLTACNLDENPPFLDDSVYDSPQSARATLDGIYESLTTYNAQERRLFVVNGFSGLFVTRKNGGNNVNNVNNANLFSLKPVLDIDSESLWGGLYQAIARSNSAIQNVEVFDNPQTPDEMGFNDLAGHAYFMRAWSYFSLVRLWGDIPLWLELPSSGNVDKAKSPTKEIYAQIMSDAQQAANLMNGTSGSGYPQAYAANMLLAKVYMTLATAPADLQDAGLDYWQLAYDQAIQGYGMYELHNDYAELFTLAGENSSESIFELQISQDAANSQMGRNYTPWKYKAAQHFGWFSVHADVFDYHLATYPEDTIRRGATYLHGYDRADNGATVRVYPSNPSRNAFNNAHPYLFKFAEKDKSHSNQYNSQNIIVYRYAELLLMLAEISNELQNGEQLGYVTQVLSRAGLSPQAGYVGNQDAFRDAIMDEYRFELIGEGEDAHNNRRRGFEYLLAHTILRHNNNPNFDSNVDLTLSTDEAEVMSLPIPLSEINTNQLIND
ncbi:MAG: RagB/SusD family nutrient uptake outer membrane protein [Bacteroidota bacterium]